MIIATLEYVVQKLNQQILGMSEKPPEWDRHRESIGTVDGNPFHSNKLKGQFPQRTMPIKDRPGLGKGPIRMRIEACIDEWSKSRADDLPVVLAVGINHGGDNDSNQKAHINPPFTKLGIRPRLEEAFTLAISSIEGYHGNATPESGKYHLITFYLFPWLTREAFAELGLNPLEEALLIYGYGYSDPLRPLCVLLDALHSNNGGKTIPWVVFHGDSSIIPLTATRFAEQRKEDGPDVLICDDLNMLLPINNSVILERPYQTRADIADENVDE